MDRTPQNAGNFEKIWDTNDLSISLYTDRKSLTRESFWAGYAIINFTKNYKVRTLKREGISRPAVLILTWWELCKEFGLDNRKGKSRRAMLKLASREHYKEIRQLQNREFRNKLCFYRLHENSVNSSVSNKTGNFENSANIDFTRGP